ncbi:uncharacterized protein LOC143332121 [Chaetodon auriga]|uniref:uncharacterized protein LOC143332121 n=1 Tax=Chaetodon auriga TaxID=39042 RepID=UPI004032EF1E
MLSSPNTGPPSVWIPTKQVNRRCHLHDTALHPDTPGQQQHLHEDAVQLSIHTVISFKLVNNHTPTTLTLKTAVPQGCVLSPLLYSLFTHDCLPVHGSNSIIKFAHNTTVIGLYNNNDESAYRDEIQQLVMWCAGNNLTLNTKKTKELIVEYRKTKGCSHTPIHIDGAEIECVSSFKSLCSHTRRHGNCFFPRAVTMLNSVHQQPPLQPYHHPIDIVTLSSTPRDYNKDEHYNSAHVILYILHILHTACITLYFILLYILLHCQLLPVAHVTCLRTMLHMSFWFHRNYLHYLHIPHTVYSSCHLHYLHVFMFLDLMTICSSG